MHRTQLRLEPVEHTGERHLRLGPAVLTGVRHAVIEQFLQIPTVKAEHHQFGYTKRVPQTHCVRELEVAETRSAHHPCSSTAATIPASRSGGAATQITQAQG